MCKRRLPHEHDHFTGNAAVPGRPGSDMCLFDTDRGLWYGKWSDTRLFRGRGERTVGILFPVTALGFHRSITVGPSWRVVSIGSRYVSKTRTIFRPILLRWGNG